MKRILFAIGFILAIGLLVGAPGTAKADAISLTMSGPGSANYSGYTWNTGSLTITEAAPVVFGSFAIPAWTLVDTTDNLGVWITNGTIQITGTSVTLSGGLESGAFLPVGSFTNVPGTLLAFTNNSGYTWNTSFPSLTALSSPVFSVSSGTFRGSLGFSTNGSASTAVSLSSNVAVVPIPPALMLFAPALLGLVGIRKRLKG